MPGTLYIVTTPIGNLEDITLRALRVLQEADTIACEDTRHTRPLLTHFDIHKNLESFHIFNEHGKVQSLIERILQGETIALVSDAGTPSVADPGFLLVREAIRAGINPVVVPGVSAVTFAVTASGLPVDRFEFRAFVPVKSGRKRKFFEEISSCAHTVFCFESPFRIAKTLQEIAEIMPDAQVAIIREATKLHEEVLHGSATELATLKRDWKGEFVLGINNSSATPAVEEEA